MTLRYAARLVALTLALLMIPFPLQAVSLAPGHGLCHAAVPASFDIAADPAGGFACTGTPDSYSDRTLLLRTTPASLAPQPREMMLLFHATRFERLTVLFRYVDGSIERQSVARGDFGAHWRLGAQIAFTPRKPLALSEIRIAYDHLPNILLARIRLLPQVTANIHLALAAALTCGALTLLMIGGMYNLSLAAVRRRRFLFWQALWALMVMTWGLVWSQLVLVVVPGIAGTDASRLSTLLSSLAVAIAMRSVLIALGDAIGARLRWLAMAAGILVPVLAVATSFATGPWFAMVYHLGDLAYLNAVVTAAIALGLAWRAGSGEIRDLTLAWAMPMAVLGLSAIFDFGTAVLGGGAQLSMLFASAVQTAWLSVAATRRIARMRADLDTARAAERALAELAYRDPLTGLLNRRGFVNHINATFHGGNPASFGLLLIDVDKFKSINDRFGHEAGDAVLRRIGERLRLLERELCITGRLGGEEFVVGVSGLTSFALEQFAERVRIDLGTCDHGEITRARRVTVSIGVAEGTTATPFQKLYGIADRALYDAKHAGRDAVMFHSNLGDRETRERLALEQASFPW